MEQSKLISGAIAKLKIAYPYYFEKLSDVEFLGLISMYQEQIVGYSEATLMSALKKIISRSKFMPTIADILEECKKEQKSYLETIIEKMENGGYFKDTMEIEKVYIWLEKGIIPKWLREDMNKYGYYEIATKEQKLLIS